jgi:hypothetical protein
MTPANGSSVSDEQLKAEAIQAFVIDLMIDANEEIGACECRVCQRLRRTARVLEAELLPEPRHGVKGQPFEGDMLP